MAVPGRAFGIAVLSTCSVPRRAMMIRQREAGRVALGVLAYTTDEAVQGDVGWSSFEAEHYEVPQVPRCTTGTTMYNVPR